MSHETSITDLTEFSLERFRAHYQETIAANPENAALYFELGQRLEQAGQLQEEAIASYLEAVKRSPETFDYCHRLGETLLKANQRQLWKKAIALYQSIITQRSDLVWAHHFLGDALRNTQQWEAACQAYRKAISLKPDFFWSYVFLGDCAKELQQWEEVITAHQRAAELKPETTHFNNNIGEAYYQLGKKYIEQNQLEKAVQCYQKALETQHSQKQAYYDLREAIARELYELGFQNAEVGLVSEGVAVFEKISMMETKREIYEYLWQGLNSLSLATLDETSRYCQNKIELEEATNYFQHTSDYKVIDMCALTADDKEYIQRVGLFLPALELIAQDNLTLEEIYINNFKKDDDSPLHLAQQVKRASNIIDYGQLYTGIPREEYKSDWQKGLYLQQSIVETGYVYTVCPFSGKVLRSNQSLWWGNTFYRFVGKEVFYFLVGEWFNTRLSIYIPRLDLIIKLSFPLNHLDLILIINVFKGYMVSHWSSVKNYISSEKPKKIAGMVGLMNNLSHYVWNDITGIYHLYANDIISKVDVFLVGSFEYFKLDDIFPEVESEKIIRTQELWEGLWQLIANNNYIAIKLNDFYIKEDLARKIYASSMKKCSSEFFLEVQESQKYYPLLWVGIRTQRAWLSQIQGLGNTIKSLYADFPNLGVIFDGWSRLEKMEIGATTVIDEENTVMEKIKQLLPPTIKTYSAIGYTNYEKVVWTDVIDLGITPVGAGLTVVSWISNKPCVVYGNTGFCNSWYIEATHSSRTRENAITPVFVPTKYIVDCDNSKAIRRGYDFDWKILYNLTYIVAYEQARERHQNIHDFSESTQKLGLGNAYYHWGMQLLAESKLDQSLQCYEKALSLSDTKFCSDLQIALANAYHNLALSKAEQGLIQDACFLFSKAPEKFPSIEETCEYIWRGLNQLGSFDDQSIYCQKELEQDKAFEYFSNNSGYQVITLSNLTAQDDNELLKAGCSLNYLRLIEKNSLAFEEIAINSFSETLETRLSRKAKRNPPNLFKHNKLLIERPEFQQSIVETGYIYCLCPFTGKILRSNQSFYNISIVPLFWYRFVSKEVFYLLVGESYGNKRAIYIPKLELIITFDSWSIKKDNYFHAINQLKINFVRYWRDVQSYLENSKKDVACVLGIHNNIGHYLWNELTGIDYLAENEILDQINSFIVLPHEFFNFNCIFPEIPERKIIKIDQKDSIFQIILANNYCAVFIGEVFIREKLVNRICSAAIRQCLPTLFSEVSKAKKHFPLIWIGIRTHHRVWVSQVDGIVNILKTLALTYPNLGVIFDGWFRFERDDPEAISMIEKELVLVESIIAQLPANLKTYSLIGSPTYEKVVWAQAIDLYICPAGSTNLFVTWIANKVGVIHTNNTMSQEWLKEHTRACENIIEPVSVPINAIVDVPPFWHWCNYECDWRAIYDEVIKLLKNINPER